MTLTAVRRFFARRDEILGSRNDIVLPRVEAHHSAARPVLATRETTTLTQKTFISFAQNSVDSIMFLCILLVQNYVDKKIILLNEPNGDSMFHRIKNKRISVYMFRKIKEMI